ncbi:primosomal protein N' [Candidatus Peregrinibacteria bacterium]|nr:MAG: primosomal protein N' [Candidatus Peregrinibacteria bacterium]
MNYADVFVQHPYSRKQASFVYKIKEGMHLQAGDGVLVPFQKGEKLGLVLRIHQETPSFKVKEITSLLEEQPLLFPWQRELAQWISEYYFCSLWDALRLFLPKNIFKKSRAKKVMNKKNTQEKNEKILNEEQQKILDFFFQKKPKKSLIQGVTGSGKTEIYKRLIQKTLKEGGQALLLVPEISLTPQFIHYFQEDFPDLAVMHSRVSEGERTEQWRKIKKGELNLVLGSRSATFVPFKNLQLIVMDEEHEWSYKQDQSPRYHTRTVVEKIQELSSCALVLGSATPSLESRAQAEVGALTHFTLLKRALGTPLPKVEIVDMRDELKKQNFSMFSEKLEQKIRSALDAKEQVLLFLNRRGSASSTLCRECGKVCECPDCHFPFTYHARNFYRPLLLCHHCGKQVPLPEHCERCGSVRIKQLGGGTEKVENELQRLFPQARLARADKDTMSKKDSFTALHQKMKNEEVDILIGTQMIGKGWDLPKVSLVGILLADMGLNIPDFRSSERGFQLLTQVAGRAGRADTQGQVLVQTYNPEHPVIHYVQNHDYESFYEQEKCSREIDLLPPFGKIVKVIFLEKSATLSEKKAKALLEFLQNDLSHKSYAAPAFLNKTKGKIQWNVLVQGLHPRKLIQNCPKELLEGARIDVDPMICI